MQEEGSKSSSMLNNRSLRRVEEVCTIRIGAFHCDLDTVIGSFGSR